MTSKCLLMPLPIISKFYREGMDVQYKELGSLKNYFGEKIGLIIAFMNFYISWLMIPGALGIIITIYQFVMGLDTVYIGLYSIIVSLWVTIFSERWKRKCSEICYKWGALHESNIVERKLRPEFLGDEKFSHINYTVDKKSKSIKSKLLLVFSLILSILLICLCIAVYFGTLELKFYY